MLEVLYHHAKFGGARISPAAVTATNVEFFLSVCLFVRHAFVVWFPRRSLGGAGNLGVTRPPELKTPIIP